MYRFQLKNKGLVAVQQQYAKRQEKRFERLAKHSLDSENQRAYKKKQKDKKRDRLMANQLNKNQEEIH